MENGNRPMLRTPSLRSQLQVDTLTGFSPASFATFVQRFINCLCNVRTKQ
jgi:hypothetical protein